MPNNPIIVTVAPNGARKTKEEHPRLPIEPNELAYEAAKCLEQGACQIHLHVRDKKNNHTLDVSRYKQAIKAIKEEISDKMLIQVTSESCGIFPPKQQMDMIKKLKPEAVSIAIKELIPTDKEEKEAASFLNWMHKEKIYPQYIVYSADELQRFHALKNREIIPGNNNYLLFVLGRYSKGQSSSPNDITPFISKYYELDLDRYIRYSVCAFGKNELSCTITSALLGGDVRIGFENNTYSHDGLLAQNNSDLIKQFSDNSIVTNRPLASSDQARELIFVD